MSFANFSRLPRSQPTLTPGHLGLSDPIPPFLSGIEFPSINASPYEMWTTGEVYTVFRSLHCLLHQLPERIDLGP